MPSGLWIRSYWIWTPFALSGESVFLSGRLEVVLEGPMLGSLPPKTVKFSVRGGKRMRGCWMVLRAIRPVAVHSARRVVGLRAVPCMAATTGAAKWWLQNGVVQCSYHLELFLFHLQVVHQGEPFIHEGFVGPMHMGLSCLKRWFALTYPSE